MGNEPTTIPPSQSFQLRENKPVSANYKTAASSNYPEKEQPTPTASTPGASSSVVVLLSLIFITNVLLLVLLALLLAKVWKSSTLLHSAVFGDDWISVWVENNNVNT
jgi:hypothetical protein